MLPTCCLLSSAPLQDVELAVLRERLRAADERAGTGHAAVAVGAAAAAPGGGGGGGSGGESRLRALEQENATLRWAAGCGMGRGH